MMISYIGSAFAIVLLSAGLISLAGLLRDDSRAMVLKPVRIPFRHK